MEQAMDEAVKFLKGWLSDKMPLGSKELYRSNEWWAWLIENDNEFAKVFFPDLDLEKYKITEVKRELKQENKKKKKNDKGVENGDKSKGRDNQLDIVIFLYGKSDEHKHCVIENKTKSLPKKEHLEGYTEDIIKDGERYELLYATLAGIEQTLTDEELKIKKDESKEVQWKFLSYKDIAEGIRKVADKSEKEAIKSHNGQIKEYCAIIDNIYSLLVAALGKEPYRFSFEYDPILNDMGRLDVVFKKHKAAKFLKYFKEHQREIDLPEGYKLKDECNFTNGDALVSMRFKKNDDSFRLGIQIQGKQYRRMVEMNKETARTESSSLKIEEMEQERSELVGAMKKASKKKNVLRPNIKDSARVFWKYLGKGWFDEKFLGTDNGCREISFNGKLHNTGMKQPYCQYNDDKPKQPNSFVYQYYNLTDDNNTYEALFKQIKADLVLAKRIIEDNHL